jgi:hypothetical protein
MMLVPKNHYNFKMCKQIKYFTFTELCALLRQSIARQYAKTNTKHQHKKALY